MNCQHCSNRATNERRRVVRGRGTWVPLCDSVRCYSRELEAESLSNCPHKGQCVSAEACERNMR